MKLLSAVTDEDLLSVADSSALLTRAASGF
jgi:hypothetical protein